MYLPSINKLIILCGTYHDTTKSIKGETCKALANFKGKPMVSYVIDAFTPHIDEIVLIGPYERLKKELRIEKFGNDVVRVIIDNNNKGKTIKNNIHLVDEQSEGYKSILNKAGIDSAVLNYETENGEIKPTDENDSRAILRNSLNAIDYLKSKGDEWFLFSGCDIPDSTPESIGKIISDIYKKMGRDINNKGLSDLYWTLGDKKTEKFTNLDEKKRTGLILNEDMEIRIGTVHAANYNGLLPHLEVLIEGFGLRKIAEHKKESFKFLKKNMGYGGLYQGLKGAFNWYKKYGPEKIKRKLRKLPVFNVSLDKLSNSISKKSFNIRFVITEGSDDIDNEEELEAKENKRF